MLDRVRQRASAAIGNNLLGGVATVARRHPLSKPQRHGVEVVRDVAYLDVARPEHTLDVYRPLRRRGPLPIVLYVHGGGFSTLSKDSHWIMGLLYARYGYLVFNISYRLAPQSPFPAAIEDVCAAYRWVLENARSYGGDTQRLVLAGESAGANLVTALASATSYRRPEPWAQAVFDTGVSPAAVVPSCGMLQVTNPERFGERRPIPGWLDNVLWDVSCAYLRGIDVAKSRFGALDLADPLVLLERCEPLDRPLPPFFVPVGTKDPLLDDTRRLKAAIDGLGGICEAVYYPGEIHAFHAMIWRKSARRCWRDTLVFLDRHLRRRELVAVASTRQTTAA